eukprot:3104817-Amphidinium_carterae.1
MSTCPTAPVRVQAEAPPADDGVDGGGGIQHLLDSMEQDQTGLPPEVLSREALEKQLQDTRKRLSEMENPDVKKKRITNVSDGLPKPTKMGERIVETVVQTRAGAPKRDPKSRVSSRQGFRRLEDGRFDGGVVEDEDEESEYDEPS